MKQKNTHSKQTDTSWEVVGKWYNGIVGKDGHYYHKNVILPKLNPLFQFEKATDPALLDLACGSGILARSIKSDIRYVGVDLSSSLLQHAKQQDRNPTHTYAHSDITKPLPVKQHDFSHATIILALQNVEFPDLALKNAGKHLRSGGKLFIVLNHPCFRIPRQSSWGVDENQKLQYRRVDRYQTALKIPMQANPSKGKASVVTWSFHHPLSSYTKWLNEAGFFIELMDEWCSDKVSTGKAAKMENRSREEIPLFLCIVAVKK